MIVSIDIAGALRRVELEKCDDDGSYHVVLDGRHYTVEASLLRAGLLSLIIDGKAFRCVLDEDPVTPAIYVGRDRFSYRVEDPRSLTSRRGKMESSAGPVSIKAPMPGRVVRILAQEGDEVAGHQGIIVIEAMKMQNELTAPKPGRVVRILVEAGSAVVSGQPLVTIE
jgi:biotin carboxyl carrier protein